MKKISGQNENDHAGLLDHPFRILVRSRARFDRWSSLFPFIPTLLTNFVTLSFLF